MEQMLPSAMVPGLVTVKDSKGKTQNLFPIDAKELIASGEYELVDNGSAEAARLNVNPLRSGRSAAAEDLVIAEVTGIAGSVVVGADEAATKAAIKAGDNADAVRSTAQTPSQKAAETPKDPPKAPVKAADAK